MTFLEIQAYLQAIEGKTSWYDEINYEERVNEIDFIDFHLLANIQKLLNETAQKDQLLLLKDQANKIKEELEQIDNNCFRQLRSGIKKGEFTKEIFLGIINKRFDLESGQKEAGYGNLDIFINELFSFEKLPDQTKELEPEMVYYQKTPARLVFELADQAQFTEKDVFYDLGSGLGQVAILINLLTRVTVKGIEFEPTFCTYAKNCATALHLSNLTFINADARNVNYADGTVFFMFTPFKGEILKKVLELLRLESLRRKIKVITYGPCTKTVSEQNWLQHYSLVKDGLNFFIGN